MSENNLYFRTWKNNTGIQATVLNGVTRNINIIYGIITGFLGRCLSPAAFITLFLGSMDALETKMASNSIIVCHFYLFIVSFLLPRSVGNISGRW